MGYVYLILEIDKNGEETYKIGITKNDPIKRQKNLQTGNPNKIQVLNFYESSNYLKVERWLHKQYNIKTEADNEWRSLTNEQVMSFLDDCKKADSVITTLLKENPFYK